MQLAALLEMLSLGAYSARLSAAGFHSVKELHENPARWRAVIQSKRHRDTLDGYFLVKQSKDPATCAAAERRFRMFSVMRTTLAQLRELSLKKVELEISQCKQQRLLKTAKGLRKKGAPSLSSEAPTGKTTVQYQHEVDGLLDSIEDAKERLFAVQRELDADTAAVQEASNAQKKAKKCSFNFPESTDGSHSPRLAGEGGEADEKKRLNPEQPTRPTSAPSASKTRARQRTTEDKKEQPQGKGGASGIWRDVRFNAPNLNAAAGPRTFVAPSTWRSGAARPSTAASSYALPRQREVEASLQIHGARAHPLSLGIGTEQSHWSQMRCGAALPHIKTSPVI